MTDTAPGEWIAFQNVFFSEGNYEFIASYATTDGASAMPAPSKRVQLSVDDVKLTALSSLYGAAHRQSPTVNAAEAAAT